MPTASNKEDIPYGKISTVRELGALARRMRKAQHMTLEQAAALSGVGVRFFSELERGKSTAAIGKVFRVLDRLGVVVWLMPRGARVIH